jgi:hypothetical protein
VYEWQVQTICSQGTSSFSSLANFTTLADPCPAPNNTSATDITTSSAKINWALVGNAQSYDLHYKTTSESSFAVVNGITSNTHALNGLNQATVYQYQVKAVCNTEVGGITPLQSFSTAAPTCTAPTGVTATPTGTTATVSWSAVTGASHYYIRYKKSNARTWTITANFTTNNYQLTGLSTKTSYTAEVWVVCSNGLSSSTVVSFKTANSGPQAPGMVTYNENEVQIAPNPAVNTLHVILAEGLQTRDAMLQVYDSYGRLLITKPAQGANTQISVSHLPKGSYRLRWSGSGKSITVPFIKE